MNTDAQRSGAPVDAQRSGAPVDAQRSGAPIDAQHSGAPNNASLLELDCVTKSFGRRPPALDHVSLAISTGETLAIVGESGSGKSTLARVALGLLTPDSGCVRFDGTDLASMSANELRRARQRMQLVAQDPLAALDPRMTIAQAVVEPIEIHGHAEMPAGGASRRRWLRETARTLLSKVGLAPELAQRMPVELSGGQRQRVCIARALAVHPSLLVLDEPLAALDVSTAAQILNLLVDIQTRTGIAYLFITHDLHVARYLAHRVAVLHRGRVVEAGATERVFTEPQDNYTRRLLQCAPAPAHASTQ